MNDYDALEKMDASIEKAREKCCTWLWEHNCEIGELEGKDFVIVPCYSTVEKTKSFESIVQTAVGDKWNWGFADEYTMCSECGGHVIQTNPDSYCWQPEYWASENGDICRECVQSQPEDYLEAQTRHTRYEVRTVNENLVDPADYGFKLVIGGCEYGLHEGQNEDLRVVAKWAKEHGLQVVFTVSKGQFDAKWNAYMRTVDDRMLDDHELDSIRDALVEDSSDYYDCGRRDYLRKEFRQYPSPAQLAQSQLKQVSEIGARFAKLDTSGDGELKVYKTFEEYAADS